MKNLVLVFLVILLFSCLPACNSSDSQTITSTTSSTDPVSTSSFVSSTIASTTIVDTSKVYTTDADPEKTVFEASTYKVGVDLPAGEYVLFNNSIASYFEISSDSSGKLESIIANGNFNTHTIVSVLDGQYFTLSGCYALPLDECISVDYSGEGMFKVGCHIPAGEYKVEIDEDSLVGFAYLEVSSDSSHSIESIVVNENFEGAKYITVSKGQYLLLTGCHIVNMPLQWDDLGLNEREFVLLTLKDDFNGFVQGRDNLGAAIGDMWGKLSATYSSDEEILRAAEKDYDIYLARNECEYNGFWEYAETIYDELESEKLEDAIGTEKYQEMLQSLKALVEDN